MTRGQERTRKQLLDNPKKRREHYKLKEEVLDQAILRTRFLTLRLLMSYIYIYIYIYVEHQFLMFLDHTQRRSTVGRTPLDE